MHRFCPVCNARYDEGETFCARDGAELLGAGHGHAGNLVGTTIADRYEVVAQIATGGMGVVYKARQKMLDRYVALKVLPKELANDPDTERRFFNEARAISQLRHPHIVTLFDFGRTADRKLFIAMEYVHGEPLAVHIENRPLPVGSAVRIADQVLDALSEAHRAGIVHRDIKPDNVMLEVRGGQLFVRLLDFGIAKSDFDTSRLTKTGIVFGTPEYIAPEQVLGQPSDHRADLYAVGLILFEMLSGHRPYGGSGTAIAYKHGHDPVPSLLQKYPTLDVPPVLDALIYRLMAKDPAKRPRNAEQVRRLLLEASLGADLTFGSGPLPPLPLDALEGLDGMPPIDGGSLGEIDALDPFGHEGLAGLAVSRSQAVTVSSRPPGAIDAPPPGEVDSGPPPAVPGGGHGSIDRLLGPRPPQLSSEAPPTLQVPVELLNPRAASRRPLVLGALLAVIGVGSLAANIWVERPLPHQPLPPRPVPASVMPPAAPAPQDVPTWGPEVLGGLIGTLRPKPTPPRLKSARDPAILPGPLDRADPDRAARRQQISEARAQMAGLEPDDPRRLDLLQRVGDLAWAEANALYAEDLARYAQASAAFVQGDRAEAPAPPTPAYGDAVMAYEQLIEADPQRTTAPILAALAHGLLTAGRVEAGLSRWRAVVERFPDDPLAARGHLALADRAFDAGEPGAALEHYQALLRDDDPQRARYAQFLLGYVYAALGQHDAAVDAFQRLLEALRGDAEAARHYRRQAFDGLTLAYTHVPGGRQQALSYFRGLGGEALARRQARLLAMAYAAKGEPGEAAAAWRVAIADTEAPVDGPGDRAAALVRLAEQEAAAGRIEPALAVIEGPLAGCAPLGDDPLAVDCRLTRANVLLVGERVDEAVAGFTPIAERAGDGPLASAVAEARFRLAEVQFKRFTADPPGEDAALSAAVDAVDAAYAAVEAPGVDRWQVAADCRRGQLHARHAELLVERHPAAADPRVDAARSRAMDHFAAAERRATEARVETRWAQAARAQLQLMRGEGEAPR